MSRVALVTGASRGIGRAIALRLAADGHDVAVNFSSSAAAADTVVGEIVDGGGTAMTVGADVGDVGAVAGMFARVEEELGRVEVLVNNAGITNDDLVLRMRPEAWDDVIRTNLRSVYVTSKAALRGMLRNKWGRIVNISSVSGIAGNAGQANYAASKAGVIGMSKSLAKEVGSRGITVNVVAPGFVATDMTAVLGADVTDAVIEQISVGRLGRPDEIAAAVAFLASDDAAYITGQSIVVDGGLAI